MDLTSMIEKVITEHGSAAVMRDHLALFRDRAKIIEIENARLERRVAELEQLTANFAAQLAAAKKKNDKLTKPERRTTSGQLIIDGILWAYTGDDDTHEWLRFDAMCPHCRTRLCVTDVSGPFALDPGDYRVRYHCDYDGCGKLDVTFRGRASDIEEKASRHILRKHEEEPFNQAPQHNAGTGPATLDEAPPSRRAMSSVKTACAQSPRG